METTPKDEPKRSMLKRIHQILATCVVLVMFATFGYGLVLFPDAPLKRCVGAHASGYCGKNGQLYTAADYATFTTWQTTLFIVWPVGLAIVVVLLRPKIRRT
ncbi:MAG TPA: hypothetical protein VGR52_09925 [Stellaceae bacterium]|nr:hypothetical protein [Stellaceae bacterium]